MRMIEDWPRCRAENRTLPELATGMPKVIVFTRRGCHLCEEAIALLARHGLTPTLIDIDADPALLARYTACVPVVEIDGRERFRGRVNEALLRRILAAGRS
jgi:glutaredoxin